MKKNQDSLLEFPCEFPIKVMGRTDSGFEVDALEIVRRHAPDFDTGRMRSVPSSKGNYISVTFNICATSQDQLDSIYRGLTANEQILMVL